MTAGYSGTPLDKKLGIKAGFRVAFPGAPEGFLETLGALPEDVEVVSAPGGSNVLPLDLIVLFTLEKSRLLETFPQLARKLTPSGMLWVSWPKKASGVATDLNENIIRDYGLSVGLVDTKVCAIDATWSGLKFVIRVKDRPVGKVKG